MTRSISITPVLNGFICTVGCQSVVFTDKQSMLTQLSEYYDNPLQVEKRFRERAINRLEPLGEPPPVLRTFAPAQEACAVEGPRAVNKG